MRWWQIVLIYYVVVPVVGIGAIGLVDWLYQPAQWAALDAFLSPLGHTNKFIVAWMTGLVFGWLGPLIHLVAPVILWGLVRHEKGRAVD